MNRKEVESEIQELKRELDWEADFRREADRAIKDNISDLRKQLKALCETIEERYEKRWIKPDVAKPQIPRGKITVLVEIKYKTETGIYEGDAIYNHSGKWLVMQLVVNAEISGGDVIGWWPREVKGIRTG